MKNFSTNYLLPPQAEGFFSPPQAEGFFSPPHAEGVLLPPHDEALPPQQPDFSFHSAKFARDIFNLYLRLKIVIYYITYERIITN